MAKERLASLFEEAPFGVIVCAVDGRVTDVNPAACHLTGRIRDDLVRNYSFPFGADPAEVSRLVGEIVASPSGRVAAETRIQHRDGHWIDVAFEGIVMHDRNGAPEELLFNAIDVSERRRFEAQLAHLAEHDPLTGLANRRRFDQELERHLDLCERYGARGALLMMDLDHFKEVNDTLGHGAGDQLIVSVAELLRMRMRRSDLVARLGGDEFAILLPEADRASAENVARDIVALVAEKASFIDGSRPRRLTASIGVVLIERAGITASQLVSTADMTMYDAKEVGPQHVRRPRHQGLRGAAQRGPPRLGAADQRRDRRRAARPARPADLRHRGGPGRRRRAAAAAPGRAGRPRHARPVPLHRRAARAGHAAGPLGRRGGSVLLRS